MQHRSQGSGLEPGTASSRNEASVYVLRSLQLHTRRARGSWLLAYIMPGLLAVSTQQYIQCIAEQRLYCLHAFASVLHGVQRRNNLTDKD
ncbi:hypothetical protein ATANTOWER_013826 [Ataeniobius toweri]|uniref:Uncharacterized protein n=1 Tax=Ataeniobius toweri TaxID=208326 RepID=A0ABU7AG70_9TELE|nr:hypothetical protein [Ataeniobius toweri]